MNALFMLYWRNPPIPPCRDCEELLITTFIAIGNPVSADAQQIWNSSQSLRGALYAGLLSFFQRGERT